MFIAALLLYAFLLLRIQYSSFIRMLLLIHAATPPGPYIPFCHTHIFSYFLHLTDIPHTLIKLTSPYNLTLPHYYFLHLIGTPHITIKIISAYIYLTHIH